MKHLIHGFISLVIVALVLFIVTTISAKTTREKEINSSLTDSLDHAIKNVMLNNVYDIHNTDELVADVLQELLQEFENDADLELKIADADINSGMISLKAVLKYKNPNGSTSTYEAEKTVVMEESDSVRYATVFYYDEFNNIKKMFVVPKGDKCPYYDSLDLSNTKQLKSWGTKSSDGSIQEIDSSDIKDMLVDQDICFYPVWNP